MNVVDIDNHIQQLNLDAGRSSGNYTVYILPASDNRVKRSAVIGTSRAAYVAHVSGSSCFTFNFNAITMTKNLCHMP